MPITAYVRVSGQRQVQTPTIEQQLERLRSYSESQGWSWREVQLFRDDGYSGASLKHPGLERLRDRAARAEFDRIVLTAPAGSPPAGRARKYVHQVLLIEEFERTGCRVEFVERPMSEDPHGQLLLQIRGAVAEYERSLITERMRRGRLQKFQAGTMLPWSRPPYGYRLATDHPRNPAGVRLEATEAAHVAEIFASYLSEDAGLIKLAVRLTQVGIPAPKGGRCWSISTLRGMLTNPTSTGTVYAGREHNVPKRRRLSPLLPIGRRPSLAATSPDDWIVVGQVPAIISHEEFEQVQAKLASNARMARRHNTAHQYLLRALLSCGLCQLSCFCRTSDRHGYYVCRGKQPAVWSRREEACPSRYFPAEQLEALVWQDLCEVLQRPHIIEQALQRAQAGEWLPQELGARRQRLRQACASVAAQRERLTEAYLAGVIPLEEYEHRRKEVEQRRQALDSQARQLEASVQQQLELASLSGSIADYCARVSRELEQAGFEQ